MKNIKRFPCYPILACMKGGNSHSCLPTRYQERLDETKPMFCTTLTLVGFWPVIVGLVVVSFLLAGRVVSCIVFALVMGIVAKAISGYGLLSPLRTGPVLVTILHLLGISLVILSVEFLLFHNATKFSRQCAMEQAAGLFGDDKAWRESSGICPVSMGAAHPGYRLRVAAVDGFQHVRHGRILNLFSEPPRFCR